MIPDIPRVSNFGLACGVIGRDDPEDLRPCMSLFLRQQPGKVRMAMSTGTWLPFLGFSHNKRISTYMYILIGLYCEGIEVNVPIDLPNKATRTRLHPSTRIRPGVDDP